MKKLVKKLIALLMVITFAIPMIPSVKSYAMGDEEYKYRRSLDPYTFDYASAPKDEEIMVGDFLTKGTELHFYIGDDADVVIPEGITSVADGYATFLNHEIHSIQLSSTVKVLGKDALYGQKALTKVTLNEGLEEIGSMAFYECSGLEEITIPSTVKTIGGSCFEDAKKLKNVTIKAKGVFVDEDVFTHTPFLKGLYNKEHIAIYNDILFDAEKYNKTTYTIPKNITSIAGDAFYSNHKLTEIKMSDNVEAIGPRAFQNVDELKKINLSKKLRRIGFCAFSDCSQLTEITIPKSVEQIDKIAFYNDYRLKKINIETKTTNIDMSNFKDTAWANEKLEKSPFLVVNGMLMDGRNAKGDVVIPDNVKIIAGNAFLSDKDLTGIYIPDSVTEIRSIAFYGCENLKKVEIGNGVKIIEGGAFEKCKSLSEVILPDSVEELYTEVFRECPNLKNIRLSNGMTYISEDALQDVGLTKLVIPQKLTYTDDWGGMISECEDLNEAYVSSKDDYWYCFFGRTIDVIYPDEKEYEWLSELNDKLNEESEIVFENDLRLRAEKPVYKVNLDKVTLYAGGWHKKLAVEDQFQRYADSSLVQWKSSNNKVATVSNGEIKPISVGTATITAEYDGQSYTSVITVKEPYISKKKLVINDDEGESYDYLFVWGVDPSTVKWTSSNKKILTVNSNGTVQGQKDGTATVTATVNGKKYTCKVKTILPNKFMSEEDD